MQRRLQATSSGHHPETPRPTTSSGPYPETLRPTTLPTTLPTS